MLGIATAFANDDDNDVAAAVLELQHFHDMVVEFERGVREQPAALVISRNGPNKKRDFLFSESSHLLHYFGLKKLPPICDELDFKRRFRVPGVVSDRFYRPALHEPYFQQRMKATGQPQASTLAKLLRH